MHSEHNRSKPWTPNVFVWTLWFARILSILRWKNESKLIMTMNHFNPFRPKNGYKIESISRTKRKSPITKNPNSYAKKNHQRERRIKLWIFKRSRCNRPISAQHRSHSWFAWHAYWNFNATRKSDNQTTKSQFMDYGNSWIHTRTHTTRIPVKQLLGNETLQKLLLVLFLLKFWVIFVVSICSLSLISGKKWFCLWCS